MQNNECKYSYEDLSAYYDGELNNKKMLLISTHIDECEKCKAYIDNIEKTSGLLSSYIDGFNSSNSRLDSLYDDLKKKIDDKEHLKESSVDKIIEFPQKRSNFINYATTVFAIAAILLFSIIFVSKKSIFSNNVSSKVNTTSVDSLEYSKFNAMIYKTKDDNKTVIWLFEEDSDIDDSI